MAVELDHILAGERMGRGKGKEQDIIVNLIFFVFETAQKQAPLPGKRLFVLGNEDFFSQRKGFFATQTDNRNSTG